MTWMFWGLVVLGFVLYLVNREGRVHIDAHPLVRPGVGVVAETLAIVLVLGSFVLMSTGQESSWALILIGVPAFVLLAYVVFVAVRLVVLIERTRFRDRLPKYRDADLKRRAPTS